MTTVTQITEGNTAGVAVSTANSGLNVFALGNGAVAQYDTAWAAHGTTSVKLSNLIASTTAILGQTFAATPACAQRVYFSFDALPTATMTLLQYRYSPDSSANGILLTAAGTFQVFSAEGGSRYTSSYVLLPNTGYRLESGQTLAAGTGRVWASLFLGDATSPVASYDSGNALTNNTTQSNFSAGRVGKLTTTPVMGNLWIDDYAVSDGSDAAIGPVVTDPPPPSTIVVTRDYVVAHSGLTPPSSFSLADHKAAFFAGVGSLADRERAWLAAHSSVTSGSLADMRRGTITA